jgi:predicted metal-binding membrane protein
MIRSNDRPLLAASGVVFAASAVGTVLWCGAMAGGMPMPGGWTMSMAWMRMAGQSWPGATVMFLGMWIVMMVAMMTPALVPMLPRQRPAAVAAGYFAVWTAFGVVAYPVGVALAAAEMRWPAVARAVPVAMGIVLVLAGALQFTPWKARQLARCRASAAGAPARGGRGPGDAFRHGLALGGRCVRCCLGFMVALLVLGVMDLAIMTAVAVAITAERVLPHPRTVARVTGAVGVLAGAWLLARLGARP